MKKDFRRKKRKGGKLDYKWLGPYFISHDCGKGFYRLSSVDDCEIVVVKRVNGAHLKLYKSHIPNSSTTCSSTSSATQSSSDHECLLVTEDDILNQIISIESLPPPLNLERNLFETSILNFSQHMNLNLSKKLLTSHALHAIIHLSQLAH